MMRNRVPVNDEAADDFITGISGLPTLLSSEPPHSQRTPTASSDSTTDNSPTSFELKQPFRRRFESHRIDPKQLGQQERWHLTPVGKGSLRRSYWTFLGAAFIGVGAAFALLFLTWWKLPKHEYCLILDEQFEGALINRSIWSYDIQTGGFGTGEFDITTDSSNNSFIEDGTLYIVPTLTSDNLGVAAITNGYVLNTTSTGVCTSTNVTRDCLVFSNSTVGNVSVIPPIQTARLHTKLSKHLRFGRVEVSTRMPTGDWIWPAIWMLPVDNVYGAWPASGEIDMVESKGNTVTNVNQDHVNTIRSTLHWGLDATHDRFALTTDIARKFRKYFNLEYTTFGLEWDVNGISTWRGTRATSVMSQSFSRSFWDVGRLTGTGDNVNPWTQSATPKAAPFDQDFYLILSVAVGGTNGYFEDGIDNKPWGDKALAPALDFWNARSQWLPTWGTDLKKRGLGIKYVKMWSIKEPGTTCPQPN